NPSLVTANGTNPANQLVFTIALDGANPFGITPSSVPLNLNLGDLEPIAGLKTNATLTLTPTATVGFTFGIDVGAPGTQQLAIVPQLGHSQIIGVIDASGNVQTPANGVLPGDAVFDLTIGGSPNGNSFFNGGVARVVLHASDTTDNAAAADPIAALVSDL